MTLQSSIIQHEVKAESIIFKSEIHCFNYSFLSILLILFHFVPLQFHLLRWKEEYHLVYSIFIY